MNFFEMVLNIGPHVSREGRSPRAAIDAAVAAAAADGFRMGAASLFVGGPRSRTITVTAEEAAAIRGAPVQVFAHSAYTAYPWRGDPDAARHIREERARCADAGIEGLVVHLPKLPASAVLKYAPRLISDRGGLPPIYLETPAIPPGPAETESPWARPAELARLWRALHDGSRTSAPWGIAIDTAHLWTSGVDLSTRRAATRWLSAFDEEFAALAAGGIPLPPLLLHLNSSERARGVGPDKHASLAGGTIWRETTSGLEAILEWAAQRSCPAILERNGDGTANDLASDYSLLRQLASGLDA